MVGRVVSFRPRRGRGIIRTEAGEELLFEAGVDPDSIEGDDLVEFVLESNGSDVQARVTRLVEKASLRLCRQENLIRQFFGTVRVDRTTTPTE